MNLLSWGRRTKPVSACSPVDLFMAGQVLGALIAPRLDGTSRFDDIEPIVIDGSYTNLIRLVSPAGKHFTISVTHDDGVEPS